MSLHIITYTKVKFNPFNPVLDDIRIEDIAQSLSLMTRANGHIKHFYSVAQHCIKCCMEAKERKLSKKVQLACLLHDASESYLSDLTRPVKAQLPSYVEVEDKLQDLIFLKYGLDSLTSEEEKHVKSIDDAILYYELLNLKDEAGANPPEIHIDHDFSQKDFKKVKMEFLSLFYALAEEQGCSKT